MVYLHIAPDGAWVVLELDETLLRGFIRVGLENIPESGTTGRDSVEVEEIRNRRIEE